MQSAAASTQFCTNGHVMCSLGFYAHNQDAHKHVLLIKQVDGASGFLVRQNNARAHLTSVLAIFYAKYVQACVRLVCSHLMQMHKYLRKGIDVSANEMFVCRICGFDSCDLMLVSV